ncbi:UpxY family transcription antiterminator [Antarcticibacterium flavum]|uniref:UpxY family transcription antiterminator n=1 Tax=Antarcticibacterium flavum TaxID=2058175 RepID=A0A5B7X2I1_9FLAO|nr:MULTISPECIES: UpxY family transcription antiterminator [Antarcticibacterium]MCM4161469.1 antitermination protein NusG [Antarcticibacterium sp. W02-3]QCY69295.1 UpxY family transcription antiterminator [Antarcticibacterium flavum]
MNWYVIYTKPRWEKRVATQLEEMEIETYCPVVTEVRQWSDRKKKVVTPLFKSYVFVRRNEKTREEVFEVPGVIQYLFWLGKPAIVKEKEIETIKSWLNNDEIEIVSTDHLSPGDQVTIAEGDFKGQEAIIQKIGKKRMRLVLRSMGYVVNVRSSDVVE